MAMAEVGKSAEHAREIGYLRPTDTIVMNRFELLEIAKTQVRALTAAGYRPPLRPTAIPVAGRSAIATIKAFMVNMLEGGHISAHDYLIGSKVATVMCGGDPAAFASYTIMSSGPAAISPSQQARTKLLIDALLVMDMESVWQAMRELDMENAQAAENVAESLHRGARVIVSGRLRQRTYETREGEKRTVFELEVDEVGPSLRYATAKVQKMARSGGGGFGSGGGNGNGGGFDDPWSSAVPTGGGSASGPAAGGYDEEPPF